MVCTCIGLYMAKHTRGVRVRVKTRYFEKFKINISTRRIQTKLPTRKRFNKRSILLILTPATCWGLDWRTTNEQRLMRPRPSDGWIKIGAGVITNQTWNISVMFLWFSKLKSIFFIFYNVFNLGAHNVPDWLWANSEESRRYSSLFLVNTWLLWFV
jgi:hypothetical protein